MKNETLFKRIDLQYFADDPKPDDPKPDDKKPDDPKPDDKKFSSAEEFQKAYDELKAKSVSKEEYDKVLNDNKELVKAVIDGKKISTQTTDGKTPELKELAKAVTEEGISNLEYAKRVLKYRDECIKQKGADPFVSVHSEDAEGDSEKAKNVANVLKECIDGADGDDGVFTALLQGHLKETPLMDAKLRKSKQNRA